MEDWHALTGLGEVYMPYLSREKFTCFLITPVHFEIKTAPPLLKYSQDYQVH